MLESRVLGSREHPPCTLQLVNAAQSLQPRGIDQILFRRPSRHPARPTLGDAKVSVDGIAGQVGAGVLRGQLGHHAIIGMTSSGHARPSIAPRNPSTEFPSAASLIPRRSCRYERRQSAPLRPFLTAPRPFPPHKQTTPPPTSSTPFTKP